MRRHAAVLLLTLGALLLAPGAAGVPNVPGDPTPPVVTPVITGTLGLNGWYTTNVTVNWLVTDPESIILSTTGCNAVTFTGNTTGTTLTCSAASDGGTTTISKTLRVDKTAPATTATPSRAADSNGWYNHELSIDFTGSDTTSGARVLLARCVLRRTRHRRRDRQRHLPRPGREHRAGEPRVEVRRQCPADHRDPVAHRQRSRLVQRAALRGLLGDGSRLRPCLVRPGTELLGSRQCYRIGPRELYRQRRKRPQHLVASQVRRNEAAGNRDALPTAEGERLVQRRTDGRLHGRRRHVRHRLVRPSEDVLDARCGQRVAERHVRRSSRKQEHAGRVRVQVRRHRPRALRVDRRAWKPQRA